MQPSLRSEWPTLLVALAALLLAGWPAWTDPTHLAVGSALTEGPGHLWGLWTTTNGLWAHGPLWRSDPGLSWPRGFEGHLIDPTSLLLFLPGYLLGGGGAAGATLGWNLLHVGAMAVGLAGAWALGRAFTPPEAAGARGIGVAMVGFAPFWLAQPWLGRTEYLALLLLPGQLAALVGFLRHGGWVRGLAATLLLGLIGIVQGYGPLFAAMVELPVALGLLLAAPDRRLALRRLLPVAAGALLLAAPGIPTRWASTSRWGRPPSTRRPVSSFAPAILPAISAWRPPWSSGCRGSSSPSSAGSAAPAPPSPGSSSWCPSSPWAPPTASASQISSLPSAP